MLESNEWELFLQRLSDTLDLCRASDLLGGAGRRGCHCLMHHLQRVNNFLIGARMDAGLLRIHFAFHVVWAGEDALLRLLLLAQICASRPVTLSAILQSLSGLEGTRVASHETIHLLLLLL